MTTSSERSRHLLAIPTPHHHPGQPLLASYHLATLNLLWSPESPRLSLFSGICTYCPLCLECHFPSLPVALSNWLTLVQPTGLSGNVPSPGKYSRAFGLAQGPSVLSPPLWVPQHGVCHTLCDWTLNFLLLTFDGRR